TSQPIIFAANTCAPFSDPGSAFPRIRDPITNSASPRSIGPTIRAIALTSSDPSPSRNTSTSLDATAARAPAAHAAPYPRGEFTTRAPAARATSVVTSALPLSTTMHSAISLHGIAATTLPIDSASFSAGITTETLRCTTLSSAIEPPRQAPSLPQHLDCKRARHCEVHPAVQHKHFRPGVRPLRRKPVEERAHIRQRHPVRIEN